ncbi:MAG TPA: hypothetical protein VHK90_09650 [Thermoanaerobaculia bacterium]|nr:hypothetical protein [Thermoanaerobaculia bacterium]
MVRRLLPLLVLLAACTASVPTNPLRNDEPDRAAEYQALRRAGSDDVQRSLAIARDAMLRMPRYATAGDVMLAPKIAREPRTDAAPAAFGKWKFLGPGNIGGRTRVILFDPADPEIMYAAGVSGGIWKSRSGGELWEPIADELANLTVNAMAIHPTDSKILYAGTGEGYFREEIRGTALPLRGNGIFISRDAGASWTQLASTHDNENFHWVNDLVISTHDPSRVYAATRTGVWRSTDGGTTWTQSLATTVRGGCLDLAYRDDTSGDYLFAACGTFEQATVYRHANAETSNVWTPVLTEEHMGRTTLAIAPSNPSVIYALSASNEPGIATYQGLRAVWRSTSNGDPGSWTAQVRNTSADVVGRNMLTNFITIDNDICGGVDEQPLTMGWYCNTIAVDPADPNRVWVGGVDLFRSDDGGASWGQASYWWAEFEPTRPPFVHADQHVIAFHPDYDGTTNKTAYFGNDGGVFKTPDARAAVVYGSDAVCFDQVAKVPFVPMNNSFGVTQFYHGAVYPDGRKFIGGTQDNGTIVGSIEDGPNAWQRVHGGDGGYVAVDPQHPELVYAESQGGAFVKSRDGGRSFLPFRGGLSDNFLFITPFTLDPNETSTLWIGGTAMWRSTNGNSWSRASTTLPGKVSAIAVAPGDSNRVLAGTSSGHIARTNIAKTATGQTQWTLSQPRPGFVTSLTFDPVDMNVVYATYAQFGGVHVWKSTDGGESWSPLDGMGDTKIPDIPVHSIAVDPTRRERLYLGTDLGVFVSLDGGRNWAVENSGFANVVTETVFVGPGALGPAVYAFTHGRGAWRAELTIVGPRRRAVGK